MGGGGKVRRGENGGWKGSLGRWVGGETTRESVGREKRDCGGGRRGGGAKKDGVGGAGVGK